MKSSTSDIIHEANKQNMKFKINPFPCVRTTGKNWRFTPRAKEYHNKMNHLRLLMTNKEWMMQWLIDWDYELIFNIEMPKSWSEKKKNLMRFEAHRATPDIDNIFKAVTDTLFYWQKKYNDSAIYKMNATKIRSDEWSIELYY